MQLAAVHFFRAKARYTLRSLRPRHLVIFLAIVLLPLGLAAWLGLKVARDEQAVSQHQFQSLLEGRLRDVDSTIAGTVGEVERHLLEKVITADRVAPNKPIDRAALDMLRTLRRKEPLVREIFVVDPSGELVFPPAGAEASEDERAFSTRTAAIWRGDAVLYEPPTPEGARSSQGRSQPRSSGRNTANITAAGKSSAPPGQGRGDTILALAKTRAHGWLTWYWEEGLHLLLWRRIPAGGVIGVEVERVALLARIVAKLPAAELEDGRVILVDSRGNSIHQWGPYQPKAGEEPVVAAPVQYPLNAWRLHHFVSSEKRQAFFGRTLRLNLILGLAAVVVALFALAFYFYRDYSRRMRDAAKRVNFVTQVSHELKTPLTNIRLYAELIENQLLDEDENISKRLSVIIAESQRLTRLINNILAFSKHKREALEVVKSEIEIDPVVESILAQFRPALAAKGIVTEVSLAAPEMVFADADVIGQIVANLIGNVEKYAADGGHLAVETSQTQGRTIIRVADCGPGIAPAHRDKIFRPFYRVSDKLADGVTGTGIGLSIARELARLSGADLRLVPSDEGACFELEIPMQAAPGGGSAESAGAEAAAEENKA